MPHRWSARSAFTLIELLVVIAIIAVLAIVVILSLNPAELLRQARDSDRLSNLATMNSALGLFQADQSSASVGVSSLAYLSVPDPSATSTLGDQCQGLGMASTSGNFTYQCAASSSFEATNGTGWLPVPFSSISSGSPFGTLPTDPVNQTSTGLFYTYATNGSQYMVTAVMESQKYKAQLALAPMLPDYPEVAAVGTNLTISPLWNQSGLVGWWPLNEGAGSTALDQSGNGNNGTWSGNLINGSHYTTGKVGPYAGNFDGSTDYVNTSNMNFPNPSTGSYSVSAWVNFNSIPSYNARILSYALDASDGFNLAFYLAGSELAFSGVKSGTKYEAVGTSVSTGVWYFVVGEFNSISNTSSLYVNKIQGTSGNPSLGLSGSVNTLFIGQINGGSYFPGLIDEVRVYNRALSVAEVQALYNAEK
jgi:prepilin-type N-terminal cleavage/methylation domain-containing protein